MFNFFNSLHGAELSSNTERGVYELFSTRYNVKSVNRISNNKFRVWLRDGKWITVDTWPHTTMFGREIVTVQYVYE